MSAKAKANIARQAEEMEEEFQNDYPDNEQEPKEEAGQQTQRKQTPAPPLNTQQKPTQTQRRGIGAIRNGAAPPAKPVQPVFKGITAQEWEDIKLSIQAPTEEEFYKNPAVCCIMWMLKNIHKVLKPDETTIKKRNPATKTEIEVPVYSADMFEEGQPTREEFYNAFVDSYVIRSAIKDILEKSKVNKANKYKLSSSKSQDPTNKTEGFKIVNGKNIVLDMQQYPQDLDALQNFDGFCKDILCSINKNKLAIPKTKDATYKTVVDFLLLDINNTANAYDLLTIPNYKYLVDFAGFDFVYDDVKDLQAPEIIPEKNIETEKIKRYRALFNESSLKSPYSVFENRLGFIDDEAAINSARVQLVDIAEECKKNNEDFIQKLGHILTYQTFEKILCDNYTCNDFMKRALEQLFNSKWFDDAVQNELTPIAFFFSPFMLDHESIHEDKALKEQYDAIQNKDPKPAKGKELTEEELENKRIKSIYTSFCNFRKAIFNKLCSNNECLDISNGYTWTRLIDKEPNDNFWLSWDGKFEGPAPRQTRARQPATQATQPRQTRQAAAPAQPRGRQQAAAQPQQPRGRQAPQEESSEQIEENDDVYDLPPAQPQQQRGRQAPAQPQPRGRQQAAAQPPAQPQPRGRQQAATQQQQPRQPRGRQQASAQQQQPRGRQPPQEEQYDENQNQYDGENGIDYDNLTDY